MERLLKKLSAAGLKLSIVTMKPAEPAARLLREKGWDRYFERVLSPDGPWEGEKSKAELIAMLLLDGQLSAERCVYIGDSYSDILASRKNSVKSIGVLWGDGDNLMLQNVHPDFIAADAAELESILFSKGV
jgi:phosphoglycolate phosphatase